MLTVDAESSPGRSRPHRQEKSLALRIFIAQLRGMFYGGSIPAVLTFIIARLRGAGDFWGTASLAVFLGAMGAMAGSLIGTYFATRELK